MVLKEGVASRWTDCVGGGGDVVIGGVVEKRVLLTQ